MIVLAESTSAQGTSHEAQKRRTLGWNHAVALSLNGPEVAQITAHSPGSYWTHEVLGHSDKQWPGSQLPGPQWPQAVPGHCTRLVAPRGDEASVHSGFTPRQAID